jgi:hypothetical protein
MSSRYQRNRVNELAIKWPKVLCFFSMNFDSGWNMLESQFSSSNIIRKLININRNIDKFLRSVYYGDIYQLNFLLLNLLVNTDKNIFILYIEIIARKK